MKNNVYHVSFNKKENSKNAINDEIFNSEVIDSENKKNMLVKNESSVPLKVFLALRYTLAITLYVSVVVPLGVMNAFKWLIMFIGGIAAMGITVFYFMGSGMSGYIVCFSWLELSLVGNSDIIMESWIESRFPFRLFKVTKD